MCLTLGSRFPEQKELSIAKLFRFDSVRKGRYLSKDTGHSPPSGLILWPVAEKDSLECC